jgi:putative exosortase-associated protein (TIGR04073 family)
MRKAGFAVVLLTVLSFCAFPSNAHADDAWSKLGRGFSNTLFGWGELITQPLKMGEAEPWPVAALGGLFKGVSMTVVRMVTGVYEIVTFPIPWPNHYAPILLPEFVAETQPSSSVKIPA